ncbi:MAG: VOC family protein [Actinomycetota bacterium]
MLTIDHVVFAVRDLDEAAEHVLEEHGLASVPGGVHPRWGTANRIIPLGNAQYLELLAVVDPDVAATTPLGRALAATTAAGDGWFAMCLATDEIESVAGRLDLDVVPGSRALPDGGLVSWRGAGLEDAIRTRDLPFFIAWDVPMSLHPGSMPIEHPRGATGIAWVEVDGDQARFTAWVDAAPLPVRFHAGEPGVRAVALPTPTGQVVWR